MALHKPRFPPLRLTGRKSAGQASPASAVAPAEAAPVPAREPDDEHAVDEPADIGWRASSYELKQGLDVVELPTSLPPEVLDRLFNAIKR